MDITDIFAQISRWAHMLAAIVLVGGTLFMRFALVPAELATSGTEEFREAIRQRWAKWVAGCLLYTSPSPRDRTRSRMPSSA